MVTGHRKALVLYSKVPEFLPQAPEEPYAGIPWTELDALFFAMFDDVIETASSLDYIDLHILKAEQDFSNDFLSRLGSKVNVIDLPQSAKNEEVHYAFDLMFANKYEHVIVLLEPHPLVTNHDLRSAFGLLQYDDDSIVIGQHANGKYFLVGLKSDHSDMFLPDGEKNIFSENNCLLQRICDNEMMVFPVLPKYSLDTGINLQRLKFDLEELAGGNGFSHRTRTMFKTIDKKYKFRRSR